jgi:peptide/nickel transport system permease protein
VSETLAGPLPAIAPARPGRHGVVRMLRTQPLGVVAFLAILLFVGAAAFAPWIAPFDPSEQHRDAFMQLPGGPYLMGTDDLGRDIFSRVLYGARTSLLVAVCTLLAGGAIGLAIGVVSGYYAGGWVDTLLQRVMDTLMAIPGIVLLLFVAALLGASIVNTVIALTLLVIPTFNRVSRGEMLRIREELYVESARASGCSTWRILRRHGLPNLMAPMLVIGSLTFAIIIIAESALSFLGIGTPPPTPSWGAMLSSGVPYMEIAPWIVVFPGGALTVAVLAFNLLGDSLRDFFDPKQTSR